MSLRSRGEPPTRQLGSALSEVRPRVDHRAGPTGPPGQLDRRAAAHPRPRTDRRSSATSPRSTASTSTCAAARRSASSAPTAPASRRTMRMIGCVSPVTARRRCGSSAWTRPPTARAIRARLGVVPAGGHPRHRAHGPREPRHLRPLLRALPRARSRERADELLEFVAARPSGASDQVEPLSGGMKRRLTIARALINEPELLLLDEPTTGLDPQARHVLWDRLFRLKQQGVTLVLTTHYMDEAEQLCDRLVVMDKGEIVAEGSPRELIARALHPRGRRAAVRPSDEPRGARRASVAGPRPSGSRCCPTGCCSTPTTARRRWPRCTSAGSQPVASLVRRSHARGRLPPPHRPDAGGLMAAALPGVRPERCPGTLRRGRPRAPSTTGRRRTGAPGEATWRSSIVVSPLLYLARDGRRPRRLIDDGAGGRLGGRRYLDFIAPGLLAAHAMQTGGRSSRRYPVMGGFKWHAVPTPRCSRRRCASRDVLAGHLVWSCRSGWPSAPRSSLVVMAPFGASATRRGRCSCIPAARAHRAGVRAADLRASRPASRTTAAFALVFRFGDHRRCSCSPARSSRSRNLARLAGAARRSTPLWHGVDLCPDARPRHASTGGCRARCTSPTCAVLARRLVLGACAASRGGWSHDSPRRPLRVGPRGPDPPRWSAGGARCCVERNCLVYRHALAACFVSRLPRAGVLPVLDRHRRRRSWSATFELRTARPIPYAAFVAPAMLAASRDERRAHRRDVQLLLQAEVQQALRRRCWPRR